MLHSAYIISASGRRLLELDPNSAKTVFPIEEFAQLKQGFDIEIRFTKPVVAVRSHDYKWVEPVPGFVSGPFCPKILRFGDGSFVQPNQHEGYWEFGKAGILLWRFNPDNSAPLARYTHPQNKRQLAQAFAKFNFQSLPALLFFTSDPIEFSRSPIPFAAIACFTDHCDFDTVENLSAQRELFTKAGIRTTKGFFLNHFSKREDNASHENDASEMEQWRENGHEPAYHSITQSIRNEAQAFEEFFAFTPLADTGTWIDHGYQPYNLSLYQALGVSDEAYAQNLQRKGIKLLWNYVDCGTSANGVINQLNPGHFTLKSFSRAQKGSLAQRVGILIKNVMFHYLGDESVITAYKSAASNFKNLVFKRQVKRALPWLKSMGTVSGTMADIFLNWRSSSKKTYPLAKYTPILFRCEIAGTEFTIFQTMEMIDFEQSLAPESIEKLIAEKGLFIAHTYFSAPFSYHYGRVLTSGNTVHPKVERNFIELGKRIAEGKIWNPTVSELASYLEKFGDITLDVEDNKVIIAKNDANLPYRISI